MRPERLIWLIRFSKENYRQFAEHANHSLPVPIPLDPDDTTRAVGSLKAWIWFEPDWTSHLEKSGTRDDSIIGLPVAALMHQVLAPTFRRLGYPRDAIRCAGGKRLLAFLLDLAVAWAISMALLGLAQLFHADWL